MGRICHDYLYILQNCAFLSCESASHKIACKCEWQSDIWKRCTGLKATLPFDHSWVPAHSFHYEIREGVTIGNRDVFGPCWSQAHMLMVKWYSFDVMWPCFAPMMWFSKKKQKQNVWFWGWGVETNIIRFKVEMFLSVRCSDLSPAKTLCSLEMHGLFTRKLLGKSKASDSMHRCKPCSFTTLLWERLWQRAETLALLCLSGTTAT